MEHSYSKDIQPKGNVEVMATRSILIPRPPQCPSCYQHTSNDDILTKLESYQTDPYFDQLPPAINDNIAKMAMEDTDRMTKSVKNNNADDEDWDLKVNKLGWSKQQLQLYRQVSNILDYDQLARLAVSGRPNEGVIRRCCIDKSVARIRLAFASVHWNIELTQWLNSIMFTYLPPTYMASYLDILQSLRLKVPTLVDKMLAGRPASFNQEYLQTVMKRPWGANVPTKSRKLPGQSPIIVIVSSTLNSTNQLPSPRMKRWLSLFGTMASTAPIQQVGRSTQSLESITEQLIAITRSKIQDLRNEMPNRHIILVGANAGSAVALQVALVEPVSSIVCLSFAFNTTKGTRGAPDDRILEITTPVLFILGENSARSSQEEIESLREKMSAQTSLVVVGSADDALRINKFNRHLEAVTQSMVDNMIADEVQDFVSTCIVNPPGPRKLTNSLNKRSIGNTSTKKHDSTRKRKHKDNKKADKGPPRKVGRPRLNRSNELPSGDLTPEKPKSTQTLLKQSSESVRMTVHNIVPTSELPISGCEVVTTKAARLEETNASDTSSLPAPAVSKTQETTESEKEADAPIPMPVMTAPSKIVQSNKFVQVKPPTTTTGRVQSSSVKNFFIRKGIDEPSLSQPVTTSMTTPGTPMPQSTVSQLPANKKIIIKSQQIIVPANNIKPTPIIVSDQQTSTSITISNESSSSDLSGILDLPILFADNSDNNTVIADQIAHNLNAPRPTNVLLSASIEKKVRSPSNIFIGATDGKLPNRPVVISAAKATKPQSTLMPTPTSNKVIFINRNQIKPQIVGSPVTGSSTIKGLQTLKLIPSNIGSSTQSSTPINLNCNQITKFSPGTKIELSTLKIVKNTSTTIPGGIMKPMIINKGMTGKNAFVIKSPIVTNMQTHPAIKANVLNRNITVRKVMNVVPGLKPIMSTPVSAVPMSSSFTGQSSSDMVSSHDSNTPATPSRTTRKTRNSN